MPLAACSDGSGAEVNGTVRYDGQLLSGGKVTFFHPGRPGRNVSANIQPDGTYRVLFTPTGEVKATVVALPPRKQDRDGKSAKDRLKVPPVPVKYTDPESTDLVYQIRSGTQTVDIELRP